MWGEAGWTAVFDATATRPGDYLVGPLGVFFIAQQLPLQAGVCVLTNRVVSVLRFAVPGGVGVNGYGSASRASGTQVLTEWPAALVLGRAVQRTGSAVPEAGSAAECALLLPVLPVGVGDPRDGDLVSDDRESSYAVTGVEQSHLGWRLALRSVRS